jgi:hypothetical protein
LLRRFSSWSTRGCSLDLLGGLPYHGIMSLLPPPPNVQGRYVRLLAMAERGTKHEAVVAEDLPALRNVAEVVSDRFKNLWRRFCETTGADSNDELGFYAGLYDGLMRETRKAGKAVPARNRSAKKSRRKAPVKSAETNVRPHVYSIALELGAEIRLNRPLDRITSLLDDLLDTHVA